MNTGEHLRISHEECHFGSPFSCRWRKCLREFLAFSSDAEPESKERRKDASNLESRARGNEKGRGEGGREEGRVERSEGRRKSGLVGVVEGEKERAMVEMNEEGMEKGKSV